MPARRTRDPDEPITEPGVYGGKGYCGCTTMCSGILKEMARSTYNYHKRYRDAEREAALEQTYQYVMGNGPNPQIEHNRGQIEGVEGQDEDSGEDGMEWQQAYLGVQRDDDEPDNPDQNLSDAQHIHDHDWEDDPGEETREQDRQGLAAQYHPYWQGLSDEVEGDSDDEADSDDEDDGGPPHL
ncbi:hypothetical protein FA13DRAFT_1784920 [Coprinellus micaceus]|uniref:Uncharacterized protein n=1 Tax=Coprinellus micaceus TaxID=71717 RepID=A0A4Y7TYB8_COPMI|nr:hypothetical protein FA13DRAFT_1784920 [Coprinellus micaceus]